MLSCKVVEIVTPKKVALNGLWFGSPHAKTAVILVHGLGSSAFSKLAIVEKLAGKNTAVITFNNRGHDQVSRIAKAGETRIGKTVLGGTAHEVFTECVDDIQGVINFVKKAGVKNIFLAGHSTGCQKSMYWTSKNNSRGVKGIILLAPISDYASEMHLQGKKRMARVTKIARELVKRGKGHTLLPEEVWQGYLDAQRFLSLYTPDSVEEIFSYAQPDKNPRTLKSVRIPLLVLLAEKDEFADRGAGNIAGWFEKHVLSRKFKTIIVSKVGHGFKGGEEIVARAIRIFVQ